MIQIICLLIALMIGYFIYFILNKKVKNKKLTSHMLTMFFLGVVFMSLIQQLISIVLWKEKTLGTTTIVSLFNTTPMHILENVTICILLTLVIPVFGMLLRSLDKKEDKK
ncbi:MAG: hypothetical protein PHC83_00375 [Bacteroidales bacterium]|nr:hypothetical protein [Bacteroidales bacterium]MDD4209729.1 hypothetical protein [Bacteroidales bacterium]